MRSLKALKAAASCVTTHDTWTSLIQEMTDAKQALYDAGKDYIE